MVRIFIVYGQREGESIGAKVDQYFKKNGVCSFLASPNSSDITPGEPFQARIDREFTRTDIFIIIGTNGLKKSKPALREINRIMKDELPCIPYVKKGVELPKKLRKLWKVEFPRNKEGIKNNLMNLEVKIWRKLDGMKYIEISSMAEATVPITTRFPVRGEMTT